MSKILVGRDNKKEVNVGIALVRCASKVQANAEAEEELAQAPVEDEQVDAVEKGDDALSEAKAPAVKGRGKKRSKA